MLVSLKRTGIHNRTRANLNKEECLLGRAAYLKAILVINQDGLTSFTIINAIRT